jgi:hypothetical protein
VVALRPLLAVGLDMGDERTSVRAVCRLLALMASITSVGVAAGCGGSAPSSPPNINLSLTAPTDGATVQVRHIEVLGNVDPPTAVVVVSGRRVRVIRGVFRRSMLLNRKITRITILARAPGYASAIMRARVHYDAPTLTPNTPTTTPPINSPISSVGITSPQAHRDAIAQCTQGGHSAAGCECIYQQLIVDKQLTTTAKLQAWLRRLMSAVVSRNVPALRSDLGNIAVACAGKLGSSGG